MNIYEDYLILPIADLRKRYKRNRKIQRLISTFPVMLLIPALVVYGFIGWTGFIVSEYSLFTQVDNQVLGILTYIVFALCGALLAQDSKKAHIATLFIQIIYLSLSVELFESLSLSIIFGILYTFIAFFIIKPIIKELDFMKTLPEFPFDYTAIKKATFTYVYVENQKKLNEQFREQENKE